jgi:hypothetical protein
MVGVGVGVAMRCAESPLSPAVRWRRREVRRIEFWECQPVWRGGGVNPSTDWLTVW